MSNKWVVDSNCFIHLGSMAPDTFLNDISDIFRKIQTSIFVTPGVHKEIKNVRFRRWNKQPNLLEKFQTVLTTIPVDESQIIGLAKLIGEKAAPQDVDLSLMVLASQLVREGNSVTLVTDDFKMTTTGNKANLGFETCPPSTFLQRLADLGSSKQKKRLKNLSRRIRAAEMQYAISRAGQYNIQEKLTWMVDSLLETRILPEPIEETDSNNSNKLISALQRIIRGEKVKKTYINKLGTLPEVCSKVSKIDEYITEISSNEIADDIQGEYNSATNLLSEIMEEIGLGLSPLNEDSAEIAHRATAGYIYRMESSLGMMAKLLGNLPQARNHFSRALYSATLIDDNNAEMRAMYQLGLLALSDENWSRAASLFETADRQAQNTNENRLIYIVSSAISRHLHGELEIAKNHISSAKLIVEKDKLKAANLLLILGNSLLAIDRPILAIEIFDEAMECAIESTQDELIDKLAEVLFLVNSSINDEEITKFPGVRKLLDNLNEVHEDSKIKFESKITEIEEKTEELSKPLNETWKEWQPSNKLISDESPLVILSVHEDVDGQKLIISHHLELGNIGLWLPKGDFNAVIGNLIDIKDSKVKVANPPDILHEKYNIRGLVAVEKPEALSFITKTDELNI
tara:strand:+ start:808 stop:2697 length:1890 start_codon:yes stop_codon:yes gene_type:complete